MNKEYLKDVLDTLEHEVPALRWIDANEGQLDFYTDERPPVAFPCCLVDLAMPDVRRLSAMGTTPSRCTLRATLQVAFNDCASLNARTPARVRDVAFRRFDMLEDIRRALDGRWFDHFQQPWTRVSSTPRRREDGLKLYEMTFEATVIE